MTSTETSASCCNGGRWNISPLSSTFQLFQKAEEIFISRHQSPLWPGYQWPFHFISSNLVPIYLLLFNCLFTVEDGRGHELSFAPTWSFIFHISRKRPSFISKCGNRPNRLKESRIVFQFPSQSSSTSWRNELSWWLQTASESGSRLVLHHIDLEEAPQFQTGRKTVQQSQNIAPIFKRIGKNKLLLSFGSDLIISYWDLEEPLHLVLGLCSITSTSKKHHNFKLDAKWFDNLKTLFQFPKESSSVHLKMKISWQQVAFALSDLEESLNFHIDIKNDKSISTNPGREFKSIS